MRKLRWFAVLTSKAGRVALVALTASALAAGPAAAQPADAQPADTQPGQPGMVEKHPMRWDLGLGLGYNALSDDNFLGNGAAPEDRVGSAGALALRAGAWVGDLFDLPLGVEGEFKLTPTEFKNGRGGSANIYGLRGHALYRFLDGDVKPFVSVGGGVEMFKAAKTTAVLQTDTRTFAKASDNDGVFLLGAGVQWQALHRLGVRLDLRYAASRGAGPGGTEKVLASGFEGFVGLAYTLGGVPADSDLDGILDHKDQCPDQAEDKDGFQDGDGCAEGDNDADKVLDGEDKCPNEPEDMDGFEDYDGCPELDNDKDGVVDAKDKCATQSEDKDGFQDDDGCPEIDNDKDGIPDGKDKCPNNAEDMDTFQDEDGCPEPDNDGDGIADGKDKCPNEAEVKNGFLDDDGCKDAVPEDLAKVTSGPIAGVVFKGNALNDKASAAALQPVAAALVANEGVKVTVKVASASVDQASAQARADAIKAFLASRGVEAERIEAVGESTLPAPEPGKKPAKVKPTPDTVTVTIKP